MAKAGENFLLFERRCLLRPDAWWLMCDTSAATNDAFLVRKRTRKSATGRSSRTSRAANPVGPARSRATGPSRSGSAGSGTRGHRQVSGGVVGGGLADGGVAKKADRTPLSSELVSDSEDIPVPPSTPSGRSSDAGLVLPSPHSPSPTVKSSEPMKRKPAEFDGFDALSNLVAKKPKVDWAKIAERRGVVRLISEFCWVR